MTRRWELACAVVRPWLMVPVLIGISSLAGCKHVAPEPIGGVAKPCYLSAHEKAVVGIDTTEVFRSPDSMVLHILTEHGEVTFKDSPPEEDGSSSWVSEYRKDLDAYVIEQSFPEDKGTVVVFMKTGERVGMPGAPLVDRSKRWAVAWNMDVSEARFEYNGLAVYDLQAKHVKAEHGWEGGDWGPDSVVWDSDTSVRFAKMNQEGKSVGIGHLLLMDGIWRIDQSDTLVAGTDPDSTSKADQ